MATSFDVLRSGLTQRHDHAELTTAAKAAVDALLAGCGHCWHCVPNYQFMRLCPTCGNKRCPHASDHRLDCTGSNEPGQPGSVYH